jgi:hypothetical protein
MVAVATLKLDGMFFVIGLFAGFTLFQSTVAKFWAFWNDAGFAGRLSLPQWLGVSYQTVVFGVTVMAVLMFWGAERIERVFAARRRDVGGRWQ